MKLYDCYFRVISSINREGDDNNLLKFGFSQDKQILPVTIDSDDDKHKMLHSNYQTIDSRRNLNLRKVSATNTKEIADRERTVTITRSRLVMRPNDELEHLRTLRCNISELIRAKGTRLRLKSKNMFIDGHIRGSNFMWNIKFLSVKTKLGEFMFCHNGELS